MPIFEYFNFVNLTNLIFQGQEKKGGGVLTMMYKQNIVIFLIAIICMRNKRLKDRNILQTKTYKPFLLQILGAKDFHSYPLLYIARQLIIDLNFKKNSQAKQLRKTNRTRKLYTEQMSKIYVKPKVIYTVLFSGFQRDIIKLCYLQILLSQHMAFL